MILPEYFNLKRFVMEHINVEIHWCDKNYACAYDYPEFGCIVVTNKSIDGLKHDFEESLRWHIESSLEDGDFVPEFLKSGDYAIDYTLATSAVLRSAEQFTTMAALSRVTGINQRLLSNYASEVKRPRESQRLRILSGIREIGNRMLALG